MVSDNTGYTTTVSTAAISDRNLVHETESVERYRTTHSHVGWGAVVAGGVSAIAFLLMFSALGYACGIPGYRGTGFGVGTAIYAIVSAIVAFFIGGCLVSYLTARIEMNSGMVHGMLAWSLAVVLMSITAGGLGLFHGIATIDLRLMAINGTFTHAQMVGAGWTLFLGLFLGLLAAALGGIVGLSSNRTMTPTV